MIWIVLAVLLGPAVFVLTVGRHPRVAEVIRKLPIQQPPPWVRGVMGIRFSLAKSILFVWILGLAMVYYRAARSIKSRFCRHVFDKAYGTDDRTGARCWYCSKCFKWWNHPGFHE